MRVVMYVDRKRVNSGPDEQVNLICKYINVYEPAGRTYSAYMYWG